MMCHGCPLRDENTEESCTEYCQAMEDWEEDHDARMREEVIEEFVDRCAELDKLQYYQLEQIRKLGQVMTKED